MMVQFKGFINLFFINYLDSDFYNQAKKPKLDGKNSIILIKE